PPLPDHRPAVLRALDTLGARYSADGVTMAVIGDHAGLDAGAVWLACSQLQHGGFVIATDSMPGAHPALGGDNRRTWSLTELGRNTPLYDDGDNIDRGDPIFPKNTDITRGHTAACPNMETHFPWCCDCHAREEFQQAAGQ